MYGSFFVDELVGACLRGTSQDSVASCVGGGGFEYDELVLTIAGIVGGVNGLGDVLLLVLIVV